MNLHQEMSLLVRPAMGTLKEGMGHSGVVYCELIAGKISELNISNCMSKDFLQNHNWDDKPYW